MKRRRSRPSIPRRGGLPAVEVSAETYERLREHCNRTGTSMAEILDVLTNDPNDGN